MRKIYIFAVVLLATLLMQPVARCEAITMEELVDQYQHATDLQKRELEKNFIGQRITGSGVIENVGEYNFFDINTDTGENYFKVLTRQQETMAKTPYQVVFLYKDKDRVKDMSRGQRIEKEGIIINIVDERLDIAVWLYEEELTAKDKELFRM